MSDTQPDAPRSDPATSAVRTVVVVLSGAADPLSVGTPLHEAGTPTLDRIARDGHIGRVVLGASSCWDGFARLLGAGEGGAALGAAEAVASGELSGGVAGEAGMGKPGWAARVDLVTVDDERVLDPLGGRIGDPEAGALFDDVAGALPHGRLVRLPGRRGLWLGDEPIPDAPPPWEVGRRSPRAVLAHAPELLALYELSRRALAVHDVNAVRVDLGENPANALWPHGAGSLPLALDPPAWSRPGRTALVAGAGPPQGLAQGLGWRGAPVDGDDDALCAAALDALTEHEVVVVRTRSVLSSALAVHADDCHAARVEAFSAVDARLLAPLLGVLEERGPFVLAVVVDGVFDGVSRAYSAEPVPCGVLRSGGSGHAIPAFNEALCAEKGERLDGATGFAELVQHAIEAVTV